MHIFNNVMEKICAILFYCYLFLSNLDLTRKAQLRLKISFSRAFWPRQAEAVTANVSDYRETGTTIPHNTVNTTNARVSWNKTI